MNHYKMKLRFDFVRAELSALGMTIKKRDDEYRVAQKVPAGASRAEREAIEDQAYYTAGLDDALGTARADYNSRLAARGEA